MRKRKGIHSVLPDVPAGCHEYQHFKCGKEVSRFENLYTDIVFLHKTNQHILAHTYLW